MIEWKHFGPIWFIPGENHGKYPYCHSIYVEGAGVLIDPGSNREHLIHLRKNLGVKMIWLSHWHEDHFMYHDLFDDLPMWISKEDSPPLSNIDLFLNWYGMDDEDYRDYWRYTLKEKFHYPPKEPTRFLQSGEIIDLGMITVEIIPTPGHTPGHLAFFFREPQVLFMGDYDLTKFGPWYGDVYSSIENTIESVENLQRISAKTWLTSHETGIFEEEPRGLFDDYLKVIKQREEKLLEFLEKPRNMEEIVNAWIVYGRPREPKAFFEFGERALIKKHLSLLMEQGIVKRKGNHYFKI